MNLTIGSHVSYTSNKQLLGSLQDALSYGGNAFMIYTGAPQNTSRSAISDDLTKEAHLKMRENNIDVNNVIVHAPYIINLANPKTKDFGISFLKEELSRVKKLDLKYLVLHPGSSVGLSKEIALDNIINCLNKALENENDVIILIETMAGKGSEVGYKFEDIKEIIDGVTKSNLIGVCMDTCHLNDAGYDVTDFDKLLDDFDKIIGLEKIKCIHINDSKNTIDTHKDRHENIGFGTIGFNNLLSIIYNERLMSIPKILETPYVSKEKDGKDRTYPPYRFEIEMIKNKDFDKLVLDKIRSYYNQ